jgi:leucyl-tRNA synthetase
LRFADPRNDEELVGSDGQSWLPVDFYMGGQEHAVLHLLYARFWHKFLYDLGIVNHSEPFLKLIHQGVILGSDGEKMSKSRGNVINIEDAVKAYGADILRMYEMFMCPLEHKNSWNPTDIIGIIRFRNRVYYLLKKSFTEEFISSDRKLQRITHQTIKTLTEDIEKLSFGNIMQTLNVLCDYLYELKSPIPKESYDTLLVLLSPFAPHLAEECWALLGNNSSLVYREWPQYQDELCYDEFLELPIHINGKKMLVFSFSKTSNQEEIVGQVLQMPEVKEEVAERKVIKVVFIPGKILNLVLEKI